MATIRKEVALATSADALWDAVRDVGALPTRLVPGFVTETALEPGARIVTFANGLVVRELILGIEEEHRRLAWSAVSAKLAHHGASLTVTPLGPATCRATWIADILPDEMAPGIAGMMEEGLAAMARLYGHA